MIKQKATALFLLIFICISFFGCKKETEELRKDVFYVSVANHCAGEIYGLHFEYYLNETAIGGGVVQNADNTAIWAGDVLTRDFVTEDFPENADISAFRIQYFVILEDGGQMPCGSPIAIPAQFGKTYTYSLKGDAATGFTLS